MNLRRESPRHRNRLGSGVLRDGKGFVLTGRDVMAADGYARLWQERREPLPLETSLPGVFVPATSEPAR